MTAEIFDGIVAATVFTAGCIWIMGKALNWVLASAEKKGALRGDTHW